MYQQLHDVLHPTQYNQMNPYHIEANVHHDLMSGP